MNRNAAAVLEQAGRYAHLLDGVGGADRFEDAPSDGAMRLAADQDRVRGLASVSRLIRLAEAERITLAGEIARRSEGAKEASLARRLGTRNAADLVSEVAGLRHDQAGSIVALGNAVRMREALTGDVLEPEHPHIAAALADGLLDGRVASAMVRALVKSAPGLTTVELLALEADLVARAQEGWTADMVIAYCKQVPGYAHPEGAAEREKQVKALARITKRALSNGLTRWTLDLDTETAGLFDAALEANTAKVPFTIDTSAIDEDEAGSDAADAAERPGSGRDETGRSEFGGNPTPVPPTEPIPDTRPLQVRRVEALALLARKVLEVDDSQVAGTAVTMLVHIGHHELMTGIGAATISGVEGTISAATARKLACEAQIIPVVLGGDSQPLDLGLARRFFSEPRRRAMAARDRGCAGPCCDAPLSWTQGAHIRPAGWGPASVDNGILLCPRCHHLLDDEGWQVRRREGRWWWTPPPHVDFLGRERPGGPIPPPDVRAA